MVGRTIANNMSRRREWYKMKLVKKKKIARLVFLAKKPGHYVVGK